MRKIKIIRSQFEVLRDASTITNKNGLRKELEKNAENELWATDNEGNEGLQDTNSLFWDEKTCI